VAANELGVLLARYGQPDEARALFLQSLSISPQPQTWHNLAEICHSLGDVDGARYAFNQQQAMLQKNPVNRQQHHAYWVDPDKFAYDSNVGETAFDTIKPGLTETEGPTDQMTAKSPGQTDQRSPNAGRQEPETLLSGLEKLIKRL
jgi:tetratricopeptide (TPR) repeat protein